MCKKIGKFLSGLFRRKKKPTDAKEDEIVATGATSVPGYIAGKYKRGQK